MKTIFEKCHPRPEVLHGDLRDEMFAARLKDVMEGAADRIYQDPATFFENTFPTEGLKTLLKEVAGRLSGKAPAHSPFVRLETSFGGGKTHNLIALWHLASGKTEGLPEAVLPASWRPVKPWKTVGIVGSDMDPANGIQHPDAVTRTVWGDIAYQLGGKSGLAEVAESDRAGAAPGTGFLERLVGDTPCLFMLDEMARYLRAAKAVATENKRSDLASQTVAFLMTLIEFAASRPKVSVVLTLADSSDAFGGETEKVKEELERLKGELAEARRVSARQERVIRPTGETEISRIVNHRLFKSIDSSTASDVAGEYRQWYEQMVNRGVEFPQRVLRPEYRDEIAQDYPFHPEFLTTLDRKTATIPNFQKTRGALRLLARVVRDLWQRKPSDASLIAIHHLDLGDEGIVNDLTSRLERPQFASVVEADITSQRKGSQAHCQMLDRIWVDAGKPAYASRAAAAIFLNSLTQGIATGIEPGDLRVAVLAPGTDPQIHEKALQLMLAEEKGESGTALWFLHWDGNRYRFKTEASLEKVIQDELANVGRIRTKDELEQRIRNIWKKGAFRPVYFPNEPFDLDDDAREPKLAVLHFDGAASRASATTPPDLVQRLFAHAGSQEGYRIFKNNVLFLVADEDQVERMVAVARRALGIERLVSDADRMREFSDEQKKKLKQMRESSELDVRVAITRAYRYLYYPSADAPKNSGGLSRETLPAAEQGEIEKDQGTVVLKVLRQLDKVLTADDPAMPAGYVKAKAWPHGQVSLTTEDLRKEFSKRLGLKILLDPNQLKKTIRAGTKQGTWIYFDTSEQAAYGSPSPEPHGQLSDDVLLYTPEEATRLGLKLKGAEPLPEVCPMCGKDPCACGEGTGTGDGDGGGEVETKKLLRFQESGTPAQVFQKIADRFHDAKAGAIARLVLVCEGTGKEAASDLKSLGLALPQLGKVQLRLEQSLVAEFGTGPGSETLRLDFTGGSDRYRRIKSLSEAFAQEASKLNARLRVVADFPDGLSTASEQFHGIRELFANLGIGRMTVETVEADAEGGTK